MQSISGASSSYGAVDEGTWHRSGGDAWRLLLRPCGGSSDQEGRRGAGRIVQLLRQFLELAERVGGRVPAELRRRYAIFDHRCRRRLHDAWRAVQPELPLRGPIRDPEVQPEFRLLLGRKPADDLHGRREDQRADRLCLVLGRRHRICLQPLLAHGGQWTPVPDGQQRQSAVQTDNERQLQPRGRVQHSADVCRRQQQDLRSAHLRPLEFAVLRPDRSLRSAQQGERVLVARLFQLVRRLRRHRSGAHQHRFPISTAISKFPRGRDGAGRGLRRRQSDQRFLSGTDRDGFFRWRPLA